MSGEPQSIETGLVELAKIVIGQAHRTVSLIRENRMEMAALSQIRVVSSRCCRRETKRQAKIGGR